MGLTQEPVVHHATRRPLNLADYKARAAQEADYSRLITAPTILYDTAAAMPKIVYLELDDDCTVIVAALRSIEYMRNARTGGMWTQSRTFGFQPRVTIRRDFCSAASLAHTNAEAHALIASYAARVAVYYQRYNPELYAEHQRLVARVLPDWHLEDSLFTSGIINNNNTLLYHHDTGNFLNVWSNMLVFRDGAAGGYLACPEYDVAFQLKHNSLLMFDGQSILHGVTPIRLLKPDGHRFSLVYYSLRAMWRCLTPGEEVVRIQKVRTEREQRRAQRDLDRMASGEPQASPEDVELWAAARAHARGAAKGARPDTQAAEALAATLKSPLKNPLRQPRQPRRPKTANG
jgi:hypothetical protein